jgi:hypothetical protein
LTSPEFTVARPFIAFRIGGGDLEQDTCLTLLVEVEGVLGATGRRSDRLAPIIWDGRRLIG